MLEWAATKLKRTWRGLGAKLRKWGYGISAAVMLPLMSVRLLGGAAPFEALDGTALLSWAAAAGGISFLLLLAGWILRWWRRSGDALKIGWNAEDETLRLQGEGVDEALSAADILSAVFVPGRHVSEGGELVLESAKGAEYRLGMSQLAARSLLDAAKLGPRHRNIRFQSATIGALFKGCLGYFLLIPSLILATLGTLTPAITLDALFPNLDAQSGFGLALVILISAITYLSAGDFLMMLLRLIVGQEIVLGADGIRFGWKFRRTFIAYADIESLRVVKASKRSALHPSWLVLQTKEGEEHRIRLSGFSGEVAPAVEERLRGMLEQSAQMLMPQLSREGRSDEEWREALGALVAHRGEYRKAAVPRERVKEILEDPAAPPEQRLGAAVALVEAADREAHRILVRVSDGVADPELRGPLVKLAKEAEEAHEVEVESTSAVGEQEESQ